MNYEILSQILWILSIGILVCGSIAMIFWRFGKGNALLLSYLIAILLLEGASYYYAEYDSERLNIFLFHLSGFVHFSFIALCYLFYFEPNRRIKYFVLIGVGFALLLFSSTAYHGTASFHLYTNVFYSLAAMSFSFSYFMLLILRGTKPQAFELFLNGAVLVFFAYDAIISLSSNFLVNEHLNLVAPFWVLRTLLLQLFYVSLINFSWQIGKIQRQ